MIRFLMFQCFNMDWMQQGQCVIKILRRYYGWLFSENQNGAKWTTKNGLLHTNVCLFSTALQRRGRARIWILLLLSHTRLVTAGEMFLVLLSCPKNNTMLAFTKLSQLLSTCYAVWVNKSASTDCTYVAGAWWGDNNRLKFKLIIYTFNRFHSVDKNCLM